MKAKYTADDALKMLRELPKDAPVECDIKRRFYFDHPTFTLPGGWKINVFIDCTDWDYIDHIIAPDGTKLDPDECPQIDGFWHPVFDWSPDADDNRWGLEEDPRSTPARTK